MSQETFERELNRRADNVHGAPFSFEDVRSRATSIRRKRRAAVAGGVAAAVALVVLVPTLLTGGGGPKSDGVDPAPPTPGHTAVLHDGTLTRPDGSTVALDVASNKVSQLGLLTDGRIVVAPYNESSIEVYAADGTLEQRYPALTNAITMSATDDAVAWIGPDRGVRVLASGVAEPTVLPGIPAAGEYTGAVNAVLTPGRVLVDGSGFTDAVLTSAGAETLDTVKPFTVQDVSPDGSLWAVQYPDDSDPQYGCSGLYDPETDVLVAESCETALLRFAPDGQHLSGAIGDGGTWGSVEVFDLDLQQVVSYEPEGDRGIKDWAWDDAGHLLFSVGEIDSDPSPWVLIRTGLDGSELPETVAGPVDGVIPEIGNEFHLSE